MMRKLTQKLKTKFYEKYDHPYSVYERVRCKLSKEE